MNYQERLKKVIKGLKCISGDVVWCAHCPYSSSDGSGRGERCKREAAKDALALLKALSNFKSFFDSIYGQNLEVANWHLNGTTEPFDSFYDSAMEEYENAEH